MYCYQGDLELQSCKLEVSERRMCRKEVVQKDKKGSQPAGDKRLPVWLTALQGPDHCMLAQLRYHQLFFTS